MQGIAETFAEVAVEKHQSNTGVDSKRPSPFLIASVEHLTEKKASEERIEVIREKIQVLDRDALELGDAATEAFNEQYMKKIGTLDKELRHEQKKLEVLRLQGGSFKLLRCDASEKEETRGSDVMTVSPSTGIEIHLDDPTHAHIENTPIPTSLQDASWRCLNCCMPVRRSRHIDEVSMVVLRQVQGSICSHIPKEVIEGVYLENPSPNPNPNWRL